LLLGNTKGAGKQSDSSQTKVVYDLLNCGPRQAFTVLGNDGLPLLVHNCTWKHQDPVVVAIDEAISDSEATEEPIDIHLDKSRAQGGTYIYLGIGIRRWIRDPMFSMGLVTRNEKLVDSTTDADALLWKADWMIKRLPFWMLPKGYEPSRHRSLSDHTITNPENSAIIAGYAATGDAGRGGRKTFFALDEIGSVEFISGGKDEAVMDSTQHVTNCRLLCSTYGGDSGVFYETATDDNNAIKLVLDWKDNPTQNRYAYVMRNGVLQGVDPADWSAVDRYAKKSADILKKLERRGHTMEGKFRSPWYDAQCLRPGATPRSIAKELDRNPRGTVGKVFSVDTLDLMKEKCCRRPTWQGKPIFNNETLTITGLIEQENGPLKLWFPPGFQNDVPAGSYAVGCDIAAGTTGDYSSNSVASGVNQQTGEQVLEWAGMGWFAAKFARLAVALSKWLNNAYLIWEASGPTGSTFGKEVLEVIYYSNVYYRDVAEVGQKAKSRSPGWWNGSDDDKGDLFETLCIAMEDGEFIPRSEDLIRECGEYEWDHGKIVHKPSKQHKMDGKAHGDRCVAAGVAWLGCKDKPVTSLDNCSEMLHNPPYGSFAWREQREKEERREWTDDEPQFDLHDLLRA